MRSAFFKDLLCTVGHFPWRCFWCFVFLLLSPLLQQRQVLALARQQQMKQGLLPSCRFLSSFLRHAVMLLFDAVAAVAAASAYAVGQMKVCQNFAVAAVAARRMM